MKKMTKSIITNKWRVFYLLMFIFIGAFWISAYLSVGETITNYFVVVTNDTYMDFFNMLGNIYGGNPYASDANYPAGVFAILRILYHIIPESLATGDGFILRNMMYAHLAFLLFLLSSLIIIWEIVKYKCQLKGFESICFACSILFSGVVLFSIERGNFILLAFAFTFLFYCFYESENKYLRIISFLCLAIASSIKIYPALFGIMLIKKENIREIILAIILGMGAFFLPFFWFDGLGSIQTMIGGIALSGNNVLNRGVGINFSFKNFIRILCLMNGQYVDEVSSVFLLLPLIVLLLIIIIEKTEWKRLLAITLILIWVPSFSYTYTLLFLIIPLISFLNEEKSKMDYCYVLFFVLSLIPYGLGEIKAVNLLFDSNLLLFPLTGGTLITNCILIVFPIVIIGEFTIVKISNFLKNKREVIKMKDDIIIEKKIRNSNLELLRIVCMLFIIAHHCILHGGSINIDWCTNKLISLFFFPGGKMGFVAFLALSTWFLSEQDFKMLRFSKMWFQVFFYSVSFSIVAYSMGVTFLWNNWFSVLFPITGNSHGFAASYLALYLLLPFLRKITNTLTKQQLACLTSLLIYIQVISKIIGYISDYTQPISSEILLFVMCYFISTYLHRYPKKWMDNKFLMLGIFVMIWSLIIANLHMQFSGTAGIINGYISILTADESALLYVIGGYCIFFFFNSIKMPNFRIINTLAMPTFAILLIHDHNFFRVPLWTEIVKTSTWYYSDYFLIRIIVCVFLIYLICSLIELFRRLLIERPLFNLDLIKQWCERIDNLLH